MNFRTLLLSLLGLIGTFLLIFGWSTYQYYEVIHADDPIKPILYAQNGPSKIIRKDLAIELSENENYEIENKDIIETGKGSRATITWPDKSITRLGPSTRISIEKMLVQSDYQTIQIGYNRERGKVWNNLIRSLIGDSYFEVNLPRESIVAGVRGTTFEIHLENRYIRAVNHSTVLKQRNSTRELFPGEMVDTENILIKKGKGWIDEKWNDWNTRADVLQERLRKLEIEQRISSLTKDIGKINISNLSRKLLEKIPGYEDISIAEYLQGEQIENLKKLSSESLISYYQKLGNFGNTNMKETLRSELLSQENPFIAKIRESLEMHAIWDSIDTGVISEKAKIYLEGKGINIEGFNTRFINNAKRDINNLSNTLSGGINQILR